MTAAGRWLAAVGAAVSAAVGLWACGGGGDVSTLEQARAEGVLRVGYANEAPFAYRDTASGRLTGEAPEIARVVADRLGIDRIDGVLTEFGALIPGLQAGRFDVIAAGMYVTPERCRQVAFSTPTYKVGEAFIVPAGNPLALHGYDDVVRSDTATLGVVTGTIERTYALASGIPEARVVTFPDAPSAMAGVKAGRVSAYGATELTVQDLLARDASGLAQAEPFEDPVLDGVRVRGHGAFAFRPGDDALRAAFDGVLESFLGSPDHLALVRPFGFTEDQLPGEATAATLCGS